MMSNPQIIKPTTVEATLAEEDPDIHLEAFTMKTMELNVAFEALESMRKANSEVEFAGMEGLDPLLLDQYCTECLKEEKCKPKPEGSMALLWESFQSKRTTSPSCFVCATPVCTRHSCQSQGLRICKDQCQPLLDSEDLKERLDSLTSDERQQFVSHMMDSYDRSLLLLQYACQFEDLQELADSLETNSRKHTHIQLGGSGMGFMAGVTGIGAMAGPAATAAHITAAATLLSPVGPPLLAASLVLGGTAACATLGHELAIHKFYKSSEEQQRYHKLLAWHAVVTTIAEVAGVKKEESSAMAAYKELNKKNPQLIHQESDSTTRTESLTEWGEDSDDSLEGEEDFAEGSVESDRSLESDCNDCNRSEVTAEEEMAPDGNSEEAFGEFEPKEVQEAEKPNDVVGEYTYSAAMTGIDDDDDDEVVTEESTIAHPITNENVVETVTADEKEELEDNEFAPLFVSFEDPAVAENSDEEEDDDNEPAVDKSAVDTVDDEDSALLDGKKDEEPGLATEKKDKHPLACLLPLAPLLDDAVLSVCKVFSDPRAGARMAITRASTNAVKVAQVASIACGALSALTVFFEGYNIQRGLKRLEGPCSHAEKMRNLHSEVVSMPDTKVIAEALLQQYM